MSVSTPMSMPGMPITMHQPSSNQPLPSSTSSSSSTTNSFQKRTPKNGQRHTLPPQHELRLEIPQHTTCTLTLLSGSAELFGAELATFSSDPIKQSYLITGNAKFAVFSWHGCIIDVDVEFGKELGDLGEIEEGGGCMYVSEECVANVAFVNTHAQLEAMRDEALMNNINKANANAKMMDGPRVLVVGPADCGKTSLVKVLTSYATKLGRSPILVDLDTSQNLLSTPGTITASPMTSNTTSPLTNATSSLYPSTAPLVLFNGSADLKSNPDLYKAQLDKLGQCIDARMNNLPSNVSTDNAQGSVDVDAKSSGIIVNGCGWIEDVGYKLMLHTVEALRINVVLVMGHDRLYSMLNGYYKKLGQSKDASGKGDIVDADMLMDVEEEEIAVPKVIKLPRSGGVVSRDTAFRSVAKSLCMKRYFYGESLRPTSGSAAMMLGPGGGLDLESICPPSSSLVHQYGPTLLEIPFADLTLYKLSSVSLSASMLPVSAKQATDPVQLTKVVQIEPNMKHGILAVCHPNAVEKFQESGEAKDLYLAAVSGMVAVETVDVDREIISLLSPGGSLPSNTLLVGDITWME